MEVGYLHTNIYTIITHTDTNMHLHTCTHAQTHKHMHTYANTHMCTHTHAHVHKHTYTEREIRTHACTYTHTRTRAHTDTNVHLPLDASCPPRSNTGDVYSILNYRYTIMKSAIDHIPEIWKVLDGFPQTLIHNDCSPRNICLRRGGNTSCELLLLLLLLLLL